jgi:hypothetical protein
MILMTHGDDEIMRGNEDVIQKYIENTVTDSIGKRNYYLGRSPVSEV